MTWDDFYLGMAHYVSTKSKDPGTQVGCVIVRPDRTVASIGFNGFPRGASDNVDRMVADRDWKLSRAIHAETNAVLASYERLTDCTAFTRPMPPCSHCAALLAQAGVVRVVAPQPKDRWKESCQQGLDLLTECGVRSDWREPPEPDDPAFQLSRTTRVATDSSERLQDWGERMIQMAEASKAVTGRNGKPSVLPYVSPQSVAKVRDPLPAPEECPNCGSEVKLVNNAAIYGHELGHWPYAYCCVDVDCGSRVGIHPHTDIPLGTLADGSTRVARQQGKRVFNQMLQVYGLERPEAYLWLAEQMGIPTAECHWAMFSIEQSETARRACAAVLQQRHG